MDIYTLEKQAALFGRYLLGKPVNQAVETLFVEAMTAGDVPRVSHQDQRLLNWGLRHSWALGLLDSGASLLRPNAELRRRLFVLFSILESRPEYWRDFLPVKRSKWYLFTLAWTACKAGVKALAGVLLVKAVAR